MQVADVRCGSASAVEVLAVVAAVLLTLTIYIKKPDCFEPGFSIFAFLFEGGS